MPRRIRRDDYRQARIGAAAALTAVLIMLLLIDALSERYVLGEVTLTALLTSVGALLGLAVRDYRASRGTDDVAGREVSEDDGE